MINISVHAGHAPAGGLGCGVVGLLDESVENRILSDKLIKLLNLHNEIRCYDCTYEKPGKPADILVYLAQQINKLGCAINLSIHLNASKDATGNGCECWCYSPNSDSVPLAEYISKQISQDLNIKNRGVKFSTKLAVLRNTSFPTIIVECCFVDNRNDTSKWNAATCAQAIHVAIIDYLTTNEALIKDVPDTPDESRDYLYKVQLGAFKNKANAEALKIELERNGYATYIKKEETT